MAIQPEGCNAGLDDLVLRILYDGVSMGWDSCLKPFQGYLGAELPHKGGVVVVGLDAIFGCLDAILRDFDAIFEVEFQGYLGAELPHKSRVVVVRLDDVGFASHRRQVRPGEG